MSKKRSLNAYELRMRDLEFLQVMITPMLAAFCFEFQAWRYRIRGPRELRRLAIEFDLLQGGVNLQSGTFLPGSSLESEDLDFLAENLMFLGHLDQNIVMRACDIQGSMVRYEICHKSKEPFVLKAKMLRLARLGQRACPHTEE